MPFTILRSAPSLGINQTKNIQDIYGGNFETLQKYFKPK